jgi:hypothetical protein
LFCEGASSLESNEHCNGYAHQKSPVGPSRKPAERITRHRNKQRNHNLPGPTTVSKGARWTRSTLRQQSQQKLNCAMPAGRKIEEFDRVWVVEGYSDLLFFAESLEKCEKHEQGYIQQIGGKSGLKAKLKALIGPGLLSTRAAIAFVFDADTDPAAAKNSLETLLSRLNGQTVVDGRWTDGKPKVGMFIVPGGNQLGEIETLVWDSWANDNQNAQQRRCVENYVECLRGSGAQAHSSAKGLVGSLLAVRYDDDPRLGPGARRNVVDLGRPELLPLRTFLAGF